MNTINKVRDFLQNIVENVPKDWLDLTTHRLDIYNEDLAKLEFLNELEKLFEANSYSTTNLQNLPTAYDYIRLGHPLSSVLEWGLSKLLEIEPTQVISFSSRTMPVLAVLRENKISQKKTLLVSTQKLPSYFDLAELETVYGYTFETLQVKSVNEIPNFDGSVVFISIEDSIGDIATHSVIDYYVSIQEGLGSIIYVFSEHHEKCVAAIQHVRRRESIAMTPNDSFLALQSLTGKHNQIVQNELNQHQSEVTSLVQQITGTNSEVLLGSCGLSVQYAIMMGLIDDAKSRYPNKPIRFIVPPNCYGGTNDQARRVAAVTEQVEILDLPVDGNNDMVKSTAKVLKEAAEIDAIPYIIAEIPTNPRVEVPDLDALNSVLCEPRKTPKGEDAVPPVFILDQTFCPNVQFLSSKGIFSSVQSIAYVSGSKFPSGGRCTAGYCVANTEASHFMPTIKKHFEISDNEATALQIKILAEQLPSMNKRIADAYKNTVDFVNFISEVLPTAKINFVPDEVVEQGFTPSVFSLDLPTKGTTKEEKEAHKRALNHKLIKMMITEIPESKYCVSYGQLKGCYWTIPATSTQGTTREEDKDYIARVSVSPDLDLAKHKKVFLDFVKTANL